MADIDIERKERGAWPWIIVAAVVILLLGWWFMTRPAQEPAPPPDPAADVTAPAARGAGLTGAAADFVRFIDEGRARGEMAVDHRYTADGIRRLAAALEEMAARDPAGATELRAQLEQMRRQAEAMERDPASAQHVQQARTAFNAAADAFAALQQRQPGVRDVVRPLREVTLQLDTRTPLLQQRERIQILFDRAAEAIRGLTTVRV